MKLLSSLYASWNLKTPDFPRRLQIETTNRCNFSCTFCPQSRPDHFDDNPRVELSPDDAHALLLRLREAGVGSDMMSWTLDGEPFMNRRFPKILERACALGFTTHSFASNGALMSRERAHALPHRCRYIVLTDFCADEAEFEAIRGPRSSWRRVLENLRAILDDRALDHMELHVGDIAARAPRSAAGRRLISREIVITRGATSSCQ